MDNRDNKKPVQRVVRMSSQNSQQNSVNKNVSKKTNKKSSKRRNPQSRGQKTFKSTMAICGKTILSVILILTIIVCIGGTALTVFVMQYVNSDSKYDLHSLDKSYTSVIYGEKASGEEVELTTMSAQGKRIWVDSDQIPNHVKDAMMCAEDKDFKDHEGVVWTRTVVAFVNQYLFKGKLPFKGGASTITQQLIKNINQDFFERGADEKVKEILGSLNLERNYTKDEILVAYLNYISLGNNIIGIEAGSQYYYGKPASELSLAQAASLAAITNSPAYYFPTKDPNYKADDDADTKTNNEYNKQRRTWILKTMLAEKRITKEEFDKAVNEDITAALVDHSKSTEDSKDDNGFYSWAVDATIQEVIADLQKEHGYDYDTAKARVMGGGLQIHTKINPDTQNHLESLFAVDNLFSSQPLANTPDAAMCIMDYDGNIVAQMGSRHPKVANLGFNVISDGGVNMGSSLKPLVAYAPAMKDDRIYWDQVRIDEPKIKLEDSSKKNWPSNYGKTYSGPITIVSALRHSYNTIPVELMDEIGVNKTLDWLENDLGFTTIDRGSDFYSTAIGNFHNGVHIDEVTAGYLMFGNNGFYHEPKNYVTVYDSNGNLLLDQSNDGKRVLDSQSAYIMNRLLRDVVVRGTGTAANLDRIGMEVVGKTGTGENVGVSFVGATPYHVTSLWMGYQDNREFAEWDVYRPAQVWGSIMGEIYKNFKPADFSNLDDKGVVYRNGGYFKSK